MPLAQLQWNMRINNAQTAVDPSGQAEGVPWLCCWLAREVPFLVQDAFHLLDILGGLQPCPESASATSVRGFVGPRQRPSWPVHPSHRPACHFSRVLPSHEPLLDMQTLPHTFAPVPSRLFDLPRLTVGPPDRPHPLPVPPAGWTTPRPLPATAPPATFHSHRGGRPESYPPNHPPDMED